MYKVLFSCNLDLSKNDVNDLNSKMAWSKTNIPIPRKGDYITFPFSRDGRDWAFQLQVSSIEFLFGGEGSVPLITVNLHVPDYQASMSINNWENWFNRRRFGKQ